MRLKPVAIAAAALLVALGGSAFAMQRGMIPAPGPLAAVFHRRMADPAPPPPRFTAQTATLISEPAITSNLAGGAHYIQFAVSFEVLKTALQKVGVTQPIASGTGGTGDPLIDARIEAALTLVARRTSYQSLQNTAGVQAFAAAIRVQLDKIFGTGTVGPVYLPSLLTQ